MERKIGEEFEYNGVRLKVVEGFYCNHCYFRDKHENEACSRSEHILVSGPCSIQKREDHNSVQFIEIKNERMKDQETKSLPIPEGWEFAGYDNGEVKIRRVEPELPTDYGKALDAVGVSKIHSVLVPRDMYRAVNALCKLLICRNAWWQKLGWKPDFRSAFVAKYIIENCEGRITTGISGVSYAVLAFPTEEVRNKFAETFRDLIEEAKELL